MSIEKKEGAIFNLDQAVGRLNAVTLKLTDFNWLKNQCGYLISQLRATERKNQKLEEEIEQLKQQIVNGQAAVQKIRKRCERLKQAVQDWEV